MTTHVTDPCQAALMHCFRFGICKHEHLYVIYMPSIYDMFSFPSKSIPQTEAGYFQLNISMTCFHDSFPEHFHEMICCQLNCFCPAACSWRRRVDAIWYHMLQRFRWRRMQGRSRPHPCSLLRWPLLWLGRSWHLLGSHFDLKCRWLYAFDVVFILDRFQTVEIVALLI